MILALDTRRPGQSPYRTTRRTSFLASWREPPADHFYCDKHQDATNRGSNENRNKDPARDVPNKNFAYVIH
jgi:hypothetical protein